MAKICYYGDKLSPNIALTPEGYMVCQNVPIARTGYQQYLESELMDGGSPDYIIDVYRAPSEVFSKETMASFEGKPVTDGHPDDDVTPENYKSLSKGHVQNVRAGSGKDANKILADLYITDKDLIDLIQNGKREVSAGYYANDKKDSSGRVCQTGIRGNHVAIVDEGRAGRSVCIRDSSVKTNGVCGMQKKSKKAVLSTKEALARYIRDASPDELEERIENAAKIFELVSPDDKDEESEDVVGKLYEKSEDEDPTCDEEPDKGKAEAPLSIKKDDDLGEQIHRGIKLLKLLLAKCDKSNPLNINEEEVVEDEDPKCDEETASDDDIEMSEDEDPVADDDIEMSEDEDGSDPEIIPTEEVEARLSAKDSAIKRISRAALSIKNPVDRKRVQDAIIMATRKGKPSQAAGIMSIIRANQAKKKDSSSNKIISIEKQQNAYDALNPHKKS